MQYYPTNAEIEILQTWAMDMVQLIKPGSMIVELGSGYSIIEDRSLESTRVETDASIAIYARLDSFSMPLMDWDDNLNISPLISLFPKLSRVSRPYPLIEMSRRQDCMVPFHKEGV